MTARGCGESCRGCYAWTRARHPPWNGCWERCRREAEVSYTGYPIMEEATLTRMDGLHRRPEPRPSVAVVIHQPGQELVVLWESSEIRSRWGALRGTMHVYWVD